MPVTLEERIKELKQIEAQLPGKLRQIAQDATLRAVEKAAEETPPTMDSLRGTNTRTGEMKQHWATDSRITPKVSGSQYSTFLANDKQYASYVNNGHRMDRHFVPGLVVNEASGMLEYNPDGKGGIVVGTKTAYAKGLFMVDKAKEAYKKTVQAELKKVRDLLK